MKTIAAAALAGVLATSLYAQEPPPQAASFKTGVELVRLDVRVVDRDGRPVRDLRQDEVEVIQDGQRRPVVFFQHIEEPTESYAEIASHTVAGEVSTNQGAARGHLYVLVFDQLHIATGNEQRVRQAAQRFVETRLRPGDRVALYAFPGPGPQVGFTADRRRLVAQLTTIRGMAQAEAFGALGSMTTHEAFEIVRGNEIVRQRVGERFQSQSAPTDTQRRVDASAAGGSAASPIDLVKEDARRVVDITDGETRRILAMLSDALRPLRGLEGRKSVLLVSEGFYGDHLAREIADVAAAAAESYSVVYALDVNRRGPDMTLDETSSGDQPAAIHDKINSLGTLAADTGGQLVIDAGQRADDVFQTLADQQQDYYLVGFTPRDESLKDRGTYRPVTVRVGRSGASVSTRTGFVLTDTAARLDRHHAIERAMGAPFSQQGLPLKYTTYVLRGTTAGQQRVIVSLAAELPIGSVDRRELADVAFVARSVVGGRIVASGRDTMPLPTSRGEQATTGTGAYHVQFEAPAGEYLMRVVVREPGGLIGSADRRFTVRALDGPALTSGDLVLSAGRGELPARPVAFTADGLTGVLELYGRTVEQLKDARVVLDLVPIGGSAAALSGSGDLYEVRTTVGGAARDVRFELPLQSVTPGTYLARARVIVGSDTATEVARELEIRSGRRPSADIAERDGPFDPRQIVEGAFARKYAASLKSRSSPAALDALLGLDRLGASDYAGAIAAFERVLAAADRDGAAAFFLGWAFHGAGDDRQAISAWRRAAFIDPSIVPAHLALSDTYVRLSQPALAIQALRAGLTALPESPELLERLSRLERR